MLNSVQVLRALAAWLVVGHHFMQIFYNFQLPGMLCRVLTRYGSIGVGLFFVISGFVIFTSIARTQPTPLTFAQSRLLRIVHAYWLFSTATALVMLFTPLVVPGSKFEPLFFLKSMLFIPAQNPSGLGLFPIMTVGWTLNYEMMFYVIVFVSLFMPPKIRTICVVICVTCLQIGSSLVGGDLKFYGHALIYDFLLGIAVATAYERGLLGELSLRRSIALVVVSIAVIALLGGATHNPLKRGIPCALILFAALREEKRFPSHSWLTALGNWSYSTYLGHVLVMGVVLDMSKKIDIPGPVSFLLVAAILLVVTYLSFRFVEEPAVALSKSLRKRSNVAPMNSKVQTEHI